MRCSTSRSAMGKKLEVGDRMRKKSATKNQRERKRKIPITATAARPNTRMVGTIARGPSAGRRR